MSDSRNEGMEWRTSADMVQSVYEDLRRLAGARMRHEPVGQTLSATALVHEAYLRITTGEERNRWENRGHFYMAAAEAMRRILIERARRRKAAKHGDGMSRETVDSVIMGVELPEKSDELLALDAALSRLAKTDARKAKLVELRYFVGLTSEEAAAALDISKATADRDWAYARAWLLRELQSEQRDGEES